MDTLRAVIADVKWFLLLLVLTVWGFTCSFYILFRRDQQYEVCQRHAHPSCTLSVPSGPCCHVLWGRLEGTVAMLLSCLRRHMVLTHDVRRRLLVAGRSAVHGAAVCSCLQHSSSNCNVLSCRLLQQYSTIGHAFLSTFSMLIGGADLDLFYSSHNPIVGVILM